MAIAYDKPFLVGDYIKIGTYEGNVVNIKFRCTRIRTLEDTIVTIQNSTITKGEVINYTRMRKRRIKIKINLPLETKSSTIENLTVMLKSVLESEENVIEDSVRVYVDSIDEDGIKLEMYLYTEIVNYDEFLDVKTRIGLSVIKTVEMEGIKISYPGENVYLVK